MDVNPIKESTEIFLKIRKLLKDAQAENVGSKLRARAREIPELIMSIGLIPTISFCLAKAGIENVLQVIKWLEKGYDHPNANELIKKVRGEEEEIAYALYTYVLLKYLVSLKILNYKKLVEYSQENAKEKFDNELIESLSKILSNTIETAYLGKLLHTYLLQFKRLCEATFKPE